MRDERLETFEIQKRFEIARARGIAVIDGRQIGAQNVAEVGIGIEHGLECLTDQNRIDVGMAQALREAMAHCLLQPLMAEYGCENKAAECGLVGHRAFSFHAHLIPNGIDHLYALLGRCGLRHVISLSWSSDDGLR